MSKHLSGGFAHEHLRKALAECGVHGMWHFNMDGQAHYLNYLFEDPRAPCFFPPNESEKSEDHQFDLISFA